MLLEAFAKINWSLNVVGTREDGYHLLDMLMQPVSLSDTISLSLSPGLSLDVSGNSSVAAGNDNLALRAANLLKQKTGYRGGARIEIQKRIPVGAGMGGGSADAAGVLTGLNQLWHTGLTTDELETLGLSLGADVPFCIRGGAARVTGIGERIRGISCGSSYWLVVIQPRGSLSTGEVFKAYDASRNRYHPLISDAADALISGDYPLLCERLGNSLQPVSSRFCPDIGRAVCALLNAGAGAALMTGSGNAVYGVFPSLFSAHRAHVSLCTAWPGARLCRTQNSSIRIIQK